MFMCFMVFASIGHFQFQPTLSMSTPDGSISPDAKTPGTVMIVFACLFIVAFASTWGPMVWTVIGEMFPYRYRADAMALATSSNWFWNFMLAFFTPFITGAIDFRYGYVFAGCNIVAAAVVYFFLMESSGRTIEEVDTMYLIHVPPIKSSKWTSDMIEKELLNTDNLFLTSGGRGIQKRNEADREGVVQDEGVMAPGDHPGVTVVNQGAHGAMSSGGA